MKIYRATGNEKHDSRKAKHFKIPLLLIKEMYYFNYSDKQELQNREYFILQFSTNKINFRTFKEDCICLSFSSLLQLKVIEDMMQRKYAGLKGPRKGRRISRVKGKHNDNIKLVV